MRSARWITLAWPGLTQLWLSGAWWGLIIGCGFAWLFNLAVISTFVWTELISPQARVTVWLVIAAVWGLAGMVSWRQLRGFNRPADDAEAEDLFRRAQSEYLTGNWIKTEQLLAHLVRINPRDVDAQLMLAGLLRRTGQLTEASERLGRLAATDGAEKWHSEIERERRLLEEQFDNQQSTDNDATQPTNRPLTEATQAA